MKPLYLILTLAVAISISGCRSNLNVKDSVSYYHFDTSLVNASPSGLLTLRAWGSGPDKAAAINEAMKTAVYDVVFKGIAGSNSYNCSPVVTEVNARERYAEYFDRFFADGGEYKNFVYETSNSDKSRTKSKSAGRENFGVTVNVDRSALQTQLRNDGIIR